jgi:hypothetical protein
MARRRELRAAFAKKQGFGEGRLRCWWRIRLLDAGGSKAAKVEAHGEGPQFVQVDADERAARTPWGCGTSSRRADSCAYTRVSYPLGDPRNDLRSLSPPASVNPHPATPFY